LGDSPSKPWRRGERGDNKYGQQPNAAGTVAVGYGDSGGPSRFFYCPKASKADRNEGNLHPTVKPTDLMRYLCRLVTPTGGTVLDPFTGSGSAGKAAILEGFNFVGIEREPEYADIARARIASVEPVLIGGTR
jgi:DNA modification methylase